MIYKNPNQKEVEINYEKVDTKSGKPFMMVYVDDFDNAKKYIDNDKAFLLWVYLRRFVNSSTIAFSPQDVVNNGYMCEDSARAAFKKLEEKGYIVHIDRNKYAFYADPSNNLSALIERKKYKNRIYNWQEWLKNIKDYGGSEDRAKELWNNLENA